MRFLHTSDWHLGRAFGSHQLLADQHRMLSRLVEIVRAEAVELVVVAGDVYDRAIPPAEAVVLFRDALQELRGAGAKIAVIAGNHDGAERISAYDGLLADGLLVAGGYRRAGAVEWLTCGDGDVALVLVPFLDPLMAPPDDPSAGATGQEDGEAGAVCRTRPSHESVVRHRLAAARAQVASRRSVVVAHAFVVGGAASESERELTVGGTGHVPLDVFRGFSYTALGHLHRPQKVGAETVRYAGAPLAYSFGEREPKTVTIVDLPPTGRPTITPVEIGVCRGVSTITGTLDELLTSASHRDAERRWVRVQLTDPGSLIEPMARLRQRFPYAVELYRVADAVRRTPTLTTEATATAAALARSPLDLAVDFWRDTTGEVPAAEVAALLESALTAAAAGAE